MDNQNTIAPQEERHEDHVFAEIREVNSNNSWIISANKKKYNHEGSFKKGYIDWVKRMPNVEKGNFVFIWDTGTKKLRYLTRVVEIFEIGELPQDAIDEDKKYWKNGDGKYNEIAHMRLRLLRELDDDKLSLKILREKGFTSPQKYITPAFFQKNPELCEYLKQIFLGASSDATVPAAQPQSFSNAHKELLNELKALLKNKKQVILTGAPGTGKTYLAKEVAASLIFPEMDIDQALKKMLTIMQEDEKRENGEPKQSQYSFRQFHPGYDYSDFVEGLKPEVKNGKPSFERKDGVFMDFCKKARKAIEDDQDLVESATDESNKAEAKKNLDKACDKHPYVMVIDEINRADLSRVFGELFYGLEKDYRGEIIPTQYDYLPGDSDNQDLADFSIPPNVYIIGTMNFIDRSVESMDFALRRRFAWKEITIEDSKVILEKCIKDPEIRELIIQLMKEVNTQIVNGNGMLNLGNEYCLGASYFKDELTKDELWKYQLSPILNEYRRSCRQKSIELETLKAEFGRIYDEIWNKIKQKLAWVEIYKAIADKILTYKDRRKELLDLTKKVANKNWKTETIDPFTVMNIFNLNNLTKDTRRNRIMDLCKAFGISIPTENYKFGFDGIPTVYNAYCAFFNFENDENGNDDTCDTFWDYFESAISYAENPEDQTAKKVFTESFDKVRKFKICFKKTVIRKSPQDLVNVLFRIRPDFYIPLDDNTQKFIIRYTTELGIKEKDLSISILTGEEYLEICEKVQKNLDRLGYKNIVDFSWKAWKAYKAAEESH